MPSTLGIQNSKKRAQPKITITDYYDYHAAYLDRN